MINTHEGKTFKAHLKHYDNAYKQYYVKTSDQSDLYMSAPSS